MSFLKEPELTGTTLVAMECRGGVAVATDSRSSTGSFISSRATDKITKLNDHIVILRAGTTSDSQAIADIVMYYAEVNATMDEEPITVRNVAHYSRKFHYNYREQLECTAIVAGYDEIKGGQVYAIPMGGYITRQPFFVSGSGGTYINQFVKQRWQDNMDAETARQMLKEAIFEAQKLDGGSGGIIHTAVIDKDGTHRVIYRPDQVEFPTTAPTKAYPNLPEHILQSGFNVAEPMEV